MKLFIRILSFSSALILSCYIVLCPVKVEASSPSSYNVDYSSLYSASTIAGIIPTLSSSAAGGFFASLGSLAYSYFRSVNVNIVPSSSSLSPTDAIVSLGKQVINTLIDVSHPDLFLYKSLNSGTQYLITSLLKDAQSGDLTLDNFSNQTFSWKDHVSSAMSDIFNIFDPVNDLWTPLSNSFISASSTIHASSFSSSLFGNNTSYSLDSLVSSFKSDFPTVYGYFRPTIPYYFSLDFIGSQSFDSVILFDNFSFSDSSSYSFLDNSGNVICSFSPSNSFPVIFYDSILGTGSVLSLGSSSSGYPAVYTSFSTSSYPVILTASSGLVFESYLGSFFYNFLVDTSHYSFSDFANYLLGFSSSSSFFNPIDSSSFTVAPQFLNLNAYVVSLPSVVHSFSVSDLGAFSSTPTVSIDATNHYVDRQIPIDNVGNTDATLDLVAVIDNLADSIDGSLSNIDFLTDAINGLVGTVPQVSVDAWNPDRVTDLATSSDIALGLDSLAELEDTVSVYVSPVFDSFPIVPFLKPIVDVLHSDVTSVIFVCIFIVVLFGFLNKLLF